MATMPLGTTWGVWIISVWLETILYGMGVLQTWLYFLWYPKDHWGVKLTVLLVLFFETLQVTLWMAATYDPLINHFGDPDALWVLDWKDWGTLVSGYICAFVVQIYFAHCIFNLNRRKPTFAILILALAILQMGAGVAGTIQVSRLGNFLKLDGARTANSVQSAASVGCDIVITVALTVLLRGNDSNVESTNLMMHKISIYAINRGALTAIAAVFNLILFIASPKTFIFFFGLLLSSKLYMNSMLGVLNTRQYIRNSVQKRVTRNGASIILDALSSASSRTNPNPGVMVNTITTVDFDDPTSPASVKTDKFTTDAV